MPETRNSSSDFNQAIRDAKKLSSGAASEVSDAAQDLYSQAAGSASQVADATTKPRGTPPVRLKKRCATSLKISLTRLSQSRLVLDGCWAECTARFDLVAISLALRWVARRATAVIGGRYHC